VDVETPPEGPGALHERVLHDYAPGLVKTLYTISNGSVWRVVSFAHRATRTNQTPVMDNSRIMNLACPDSGPEFPEVR
jgi:hypothetical protein